jgi:hypothetical protein
LAAADAASPPGAVLEPDADHHAAPMATAMATAAAADIVFLDAIECLRAAASARRLNEGMLPNSVSGAC